MRYLVKFNESINRSELKVFCDDALAYLYDLGFSVSVDFEYNHNKLISIYNVITIKNSSTFLWNDVKDYIIPFITILSENYNLDRKRCITLSGTKYYVWRDPFTQLGMDDRKYDSKVITKIYTPQNIIDERIRFDDKLNSIKIFMKE